MGMYINPDNELFMSAVNSEIFVDKSMLIDITNRFINTNQKHICISRPRRFGKSVTAHMLIAYYSKNCDSRELFGKLEIAQTEKFEKHLNKYNVVYLSIQNFAEQVSDINKMIELITKLVVRELTAEFPDADYFDKTSLGLVFDDIYVAYKQQFVFIIDEWDCIFRTFKDDKDNQQKFLSFLRNILKDKPYVALDYATGILPVKKYGQHSTLNMYNEYSMQTANPFSEFTGFTEDEVAQLCKKYDLPPDEVKKWYNGYQVDGLSIYNPQSVVNACTRKVLSNYWTLTETYDALRYYIRMNFDGLRDTVVRMIAGAKVKVDSATFVNDMVTFETADDILTLLIHLGYLTYDFETKEAWIPNYEVREHFISTVKVLKWQEVTKLLQISDELLRATLSVDSEKVSELIGSAHEAYTSIIKYNDENSLACVINLAYYSAQNDYIIHREFATGKGYADIVLIPRVSGSAPAIIVELKYNKAADTAIEQIKAKHYPQKIAEYSGEILLVGISYDESKGHSCIIEKITK